MEATLNGTADTWRERITSQQASGESIRGWCRQNNHHEHAFYWWRARLGLSPRLARKRPRGQPNRIKFTEVVVDRAEAISLRLAGGRELLLPASMAIEQVAKLVRAIEDQA